MIAGGKELATVNGDVGWPIEPAKAGLGYSGSITG